MIATLTFTEPQSDADGRRVAGARFEPRSRLPLSAACLVANGLRELLSRLLAVELETELLEPLVPSPAVRPVLFADAIVACVRGRVADAYIVVRPADARRLVALAFGEAERPDGDPLSEIESQTLDRAMLALAPLCGSLCGPSTGAARIAATTAECDSESYFEVRLLLERPVTIGFALSREPAFEIGARVAIADLEQVEIELRAECARGRLELVDVATLAVGAIVPLTTRIGDPGWLCLGDRSIARGSCGANGGRAAFVVDGDRERAA